MSHPSAPPTRDEISALIAARAWKDESFHQAVLANPSKVYEEQFGVKPPPGMTIKVVEDTDTLVHFVLPVKPSGFGELSDDDLAGIAGGAGSVQSQLARNPFSPPTVKSSATW